MNTTEHNDIENARIGYQVASNLWVCAAGILWSKFNALLLANSIVIGSMILSMTVSKCFSIFISIGMSIAGIFLCILWFLLTKRTLEGYEYWIHSTREIEEKFLTPSVKTVSRGGDFADGKEVSLNIGYKSKPMRISWFGRLLHDKVTSYAIIFIFFLMHILILILTVTLKNG